MYCRSEMSPQIPARKAEIDHFNFMPGGLCSACHITKPQRGGREKVTLPVAVYEEDSQGADLPTVLRRRHYHGYGECQLASASATEIHSPFAMKERTGIA